MSFAGSCEDRLAIRELVESYNDAVMRFDADAYASNWAEDATWSLPGMGEVQGRDAILAMWKQAMGALEVEGFFASAGSIVVDGDQASGTWYQQEYLRAGGARQFIIGEYTDSYVRSGGRWLFAKRVYNVRLREVLPSA